MILIGHGGLAKIRAKSLNEELPDTIEVYEISVSMVYEKY
jgi:hypothetical protein